MQSIVDQFSTFWEPRPKPRRRFLRVAGVSALALSLVLTLAVGALAHQTAGFHAAHDGRILPGALIAGVDVGGMTPQRALTEVERVVDVELDREITITWGEHSWTSTPRALGSASDAEAVVGEALSASQQVEWGDLFQMRWRGGLLGFDRAVRITHAPETARAWVDAIASHINLEPRDAAIDTSSGWVEFTSARNGHLVDTAATYAALVDALEGGTDEVQLRVQALLPDVTDAEFRQVLLLRQAEHRLYLYNDGELTHQWAVAIGDRASGYPTPRGEFTVTLKRYMPTWINPDPTGWGAGMPARIGPGANNPLGVRALNWSVGAIRFHGTANVNSIGRSASKGCVRLTNSDVIELYDLVDEGAVISSL
jgi:lipoprotein-anchoring transpeptidase ErfK/SrfK